MITVKRKARFTKAKKRQTKAEAPVGRVPRVARLMALGIRFDQLIRDGVVADQAEIARLGGFSRARMTQILALTNLAPEFQEQLLDLLPSKTGRDMVSERKLRAITSVLNWQLQRRLWPRR